ncbi:SH3 domain-containing protein [Streptomyces sp. ACT015]|uniref:SH3 domain-containing protein n=1 Tax=Streptomyces sp. ACT015 TaxID=3134807 RepID=UPI003D17CD70
MGRKAMRSLVVSGALVAAVGAVGVSAASAMIPPDPGGSSSSALIDSGDRDVVKTVTVDGLRVRTGPGTGHSILGLLYRDEPVRVVATRYDSTGQRWDEVRLQRGSAGGLPGGYIGWVTEMYLF